jgi:hypothetical protein
VADLKAIVARWSAFHAGQADDGVTDSKLGDACTDGHDQVVGALVTNRERIVTAVADIHELVAAVEKETHRVEMAKVLINAMGQTNEWRRETLGVPLDLDGSVEAVNERIVELVETEKLLRAAGEASDPDREDDVAFDKAWDAVATAAARLAGQGQPVAVSELTARLADTEPAPDAAMVEVVANAVLEALERVSTHGYGAMEGDIEADRESYGDDIALIRTELLEMFSLRERLAVLERKDATLLQVFRLVCDRIRAIADEANSPHPSIDVDEAMTEIERALYDLRQQRIAANKALSTAKREPTKSEVE